MKLLAVVLGLSVVPAFCHEEGLEFLRTRASVMSAVSEIFTDDGLRPTDVSFRQIALERLNRLKQNLGSDQGLWIEPEVIVSECAEAGRAITTLSDFMRMIYLCWIVKCGAGSRASESFARARVTLLSLLYLKTRRERL